jgi:uncharacterized protein DUF6326
MHSKFRQKEENFSMTTIKTAEMKDSMRSIMPKMSIPVLLSTLWIFFTFNAAYGDIGTLYQSVYVGIIKNGIQYTQVFLLFGDLLVEIGMVMILLSRILNRRANRLTNIAAGLFLTAVQAVSLFVGTPTLAYTFISIMMIGAGVAIVWSAWNWHAVPSSPEISQTPPNL